ncbi:MAG: cytochrome C oxidase subunit IV family protein [Myxococcota bacterium]
MAAHGHDDHGDELGHVASWQTLVGTFVALLFLTVVTVLVADLPYSSRAAALAVAMLIATIKASVVVLYFMHLRYDRLFHSVIFVGSILAAVLFVGFTLVDRGQYEQDVVWDADNPPAVKPYIPEP